MAMQDPNRRIQETVHALTKWFEKIPDLKLVICDGSGFNWEPVLTPIFVGKQIECLNHMNDREKVKRWGGGYGESQTMNYVIEKSTTVSEAGRFMKCTGKYWVDNINDFDFTNFHSGFKCKCVFKRMRVLYINTVFYVADINTYKFLFSNVYDEIDDHNDKAIETIMGQILVRKKFRGFQLRTIPSILGWSAHVDEPLLLDHSLRSYARAIKYKILSYIL